MSVYGDYEKYKAFALVESEEIRRDFSWENIAKIGSDAVEDFMKREPWKNRKIKPNEFVVSYLDGPRVEVKGNDPQEYKIEFINKETGENIYTSIIKNGMWTAAGPKYYVPWVIKVNGQVIDEFEISKKTVLISIESKASGDTRSEEHTSELQSH